MTEKDRLEKLEAHVLRLELRIVDLEADKLGPFIVPSLDPAYENKCSICLIDFTGTMDYVCDNIACPMYPKTGNIIFGSDTGG